MYVCECMCVSVCVSVEEGSDSKQDNVIGLLTHSKFVHAPQCKVQMSSSSLLLFQMASN